MKSARFPVKKAVLAALMTVMAVGADAQSQREQLKQMVEQLQKQPGDNALREKIVRLGAKIKPPPAVPEDANRAFVKGNVFQKQATDASGYELAIAAYREALRVAPWWADAYYNLAVALESDRKFNEAIDATRLYMASVPAGSAEAREAQNRIYALEASDELASKQAATAARAEEERRRPTVEGTWSLVMFDFQVVRNGDQFRIVGEKSYGKPGGWHATNVVMDPGHLRFRLEQYDCPQCVADMDLSLSSSGNELVGTSSSVNGTLPTKAIRVP